MIGLPCTQKVLRLCSRCCHCPTSCPYHFSLDWTYFQLRAPAFPWLSSFSGHLSLFCIFQQQGRCSREFILPGSSPQMITDGSWYTNILAFSPFGHLFYTGPQSFSVWLSPHRGSWLDNRPFVGCLPFSVLFPDFTTGIFFSCPIRDLLSNPWLTICLPENPWQKRMLAKWMSEPLPNHSTHYSWAWKLIANSHACRSQGEQIPGRKSQPWFLSLPTFVTEIHAREHYFT